MGYVKVPAPPYECCPKCGASNHGRSHSVWRVADGSGGHGECDVCASQWPLVVAPDRAS